MWWSCSTPTRRGGSAVMMMLFIAAGIGLLMLTRFGFHGFWWIFFLLPCIFIPAAKYRRSGYGHYDGDFEKPKRDGEKPKRQSRYIRDDNGDLLEVIEDQPKRRDDDDDIFYV